MRRHLVSLLALGLVCGCGGGGGSPAADPATIGAPAAPARTMEEVLSDCFTQDVRDGVAFLESVAELARDGALEGFALTGFDLASLRFGWTLDGDLDGAPEAEGSLRFLDAAGRPTLPRDLGSGDMGTLIAGGVAPETLFASVPDGTRALLTFDLLRFVDGRGELDIEFVAGRVLRARGSQTLADGPCSATLRFEDLLLPAADDGFPVGVVRLEARAGTDRVDGTLTVDGTSVGLLRGTVAGGAPQDAALDFATGRFR